MASQDTEDLIAGIKRIATVQAQQVSELRLSLARIQIAAERALDQCVNDECRVELNRIAAEARRAMP